MPCEDAVRCDNLQNVQGITRIASDPATEEVDGTSTAVLDGWYEFSGGGNEYSGTFRSVRIGTTCYIEWTWTDGDDEQAGTSSPTVAGEFRPGNVGLTNTHMGGYFPNGPDNMPTTENLLYWAGYNVTTTRRFVVDAIAVMDGAEFRWGIEYDLTAQECQA